MASKSLDERDLIAALLHDVHTSHAEVFSHTDLEKTISIVDSRLRWEGVSFLTKTLPSLGKALDKALCDGYLPDLSELRFSTQPDSKLPVLFGGLFRQVFSDVGEVLPSACATAVRVLRQLTYLFYKYELPYTTDQERAVISQFKEAEDDLSLTDVHLREIAEELWHQPPRRFSCKNDTMAEVAREAQRLLQTVLMSFDPLDITPCHGPGVVATKQRLWSKYEWANISNRLSEMYPIDAYFMASVGAVCDKFQDLVKISGEDLPAKVILVPKDSRGPRLISCEPVDFQWIQGGLRKALVKHVERHPLTRGRVNFTHQGHNRSAALKGSLDGESVTLDLKEASDRVSLELVRLLFPSRIVGYLEASRSLSTILPDGSELKLRKFAPMGSSLCFPVMALTIWALVTAAVSDGNARRSILVYGDDVIVPRGNTRDAIEVLEAFGLKVNASKCCTTGFFRESCGMDAFKGVDVTPVRLRTVWSSSQSPDAYCSWIAYANSFFDRRYYAMYDTIVEALHAVYGAIPSIDMQLACPSLRSVERKWLPRKSRSNPHLHKREWYVRDVKAPRIMHESEGWTMLLRFFTESGGGGPSSERSVRTKATDSFIQSAPFSVRSYTHRHASKLVWRWR